MFRIRIMSCCLDFKAWKWTNCSKKKQHNFGLL